MLLGTTSSVRPGARLCPTRCRRAGPRWCSTLTPVTTRPNDSLFRLLSHRSGVERGDPRYEPERNPVSRMLEVKRGGDEPTELDQLTLDVRRDCDSGYLTRSEAFMRRKVDDGTPFSWTSTTRPCTCRSFLGVSSKGA